MTAVDFHSDGMFDGYPVLHKKWSFPLKISSVNVTKSASFLRIWSHLLKKSLMENFIFCLVPKSMLLSPTVQWNQNYRWNNILTGSGGSSNRVYLFCWFPWKLVCKSTEINPPQPSVAFHMEARFLYKMQHWAERCEGKYWYEMG